MKIVSFIVCAFILTFLSSSTYALFDDEEIGAIKGLATSWNDQWRNIGFVHQTKAVIDGVIARMDWKIGNIEQQAKPYVDSLQAKQKAVQDAINARQPDSVIQQRYTELQTEQQKHGQTLQSMSYEINTLGQQRTWLEGIQYYSQQLEACQLRTQWIECRESQGTPATPADIIEERRSLNTMVRTTGIADIPTENLEIQESWTNVQVLEKQRELCAIKAGVVHKHLEKTLETQEQQQQAYINQQDQVRHGL